MTGSPAAGAVAVLHPPYVPLRPAELRAYHEAGHAVAAVLRGVRLTRVSIARSGRWGGACEYVLRVRFHVARGRRATLPPAVLRRVARTAAAVVLGGSIAQDGYALGRGVILLDRRTNRPFALFSPGAEHDERDARAVARGVYPRGRAQREFLRRMRSATERRLAAGRPWRAVETLARALLRARTLPGSRAERIVRRVLARAARSPARARGERPATAA